MVDALPCVRAGNVRQFCGYGLASASAVVSFCSQERLHAAGALSAQDMYAMWEGGACAHAQTCMLCGCIEHATHGSVCLKKLRLTKATLSLESRAMLQNAALPVKDGTNEAPWPHVHSSLPPVLLVNAAVRHGGGAQEDAFTPADIDGSGGLTFDEWMRAFRGNGGVKAHVLRALFDDFDADQDCSVSLAEFQAGVEPRSLLKWALQSAETVLRRLVYALSAFGLESGSAGGRTMWGSGGAQLHSDMERSIVDLLLLAFADFLIGLRLSSVWPTGVDN